MVSNTTDVHDSFGGFAFVLRSLKLSLNLYKKRHKGMMNTYELNAM